MEVARPRLTRLARLVSLYGQGLRELCIFDDNLPVCDLPTFEWTRADGYADQAYFEQDVHGAQLFAAIKEVFDVAPAMAADVIRILLQYGSMFSDARYSAFPRPELAEFLLHMPLELVHTAIDCGWLCLERHIQEVINGFPGRWRNLSVDGWVTLSEFDPSAEDLTLNSETVLKEILRVPTFTPDVLAHADTPMEQLNSLLTAWEDAADRVGIDAVACHCGFAEQCNSWYSAIPLDRSLQVRYVCFMKRVIDAVRRNGKAHKRHAVYCGGENSCMCELRGAKCITAEVRQRMNKDLVLAELLALNELTIAAPDRYNPLQIMADAYARLYLPSVLGPRAVTATADDGKPALKRPKVSRHCAAVYKALPASIPDSLLPLVYAYVAHTYDDDGKPVVQAEPTAKEEDARPASAAASAAEKEQVKRASAAASATAAVVPVAAPSLIDLWVGERMDRLSPVESSTWDLAAFLARVYGRSDIQNQMRRDSYTLNKRKLDQLGPRARAVAMAKARTPKHAQKIMTPSDFKSRRRPKRQRVEPSDAAAVASASDKDEKMARVVATVNEVVQAVRASGEQSHRPAVAAAAIAAAAMGMHATSDPDGDDDDADSEQDVVEIPKPSRRPAAAAAAAAASASSASSIYEDLLYDV